MATDEPQLKVGAHVLVQLGSELVTDVEQAILECVKNSYDADAPGCLIEIDTEECGARSERGEAKRLLNFSRPSESVDVELLDARGKVLRSGVDISDGQEIQRQLNYRGRITIEDRGDGLSTKQLEDSWLVISGSSKRGPQGQQKQKTRLGRTPLGDKGLGRLGSMKLGDILLIETATSKSEKIASAQFRWTDCETARTVDEIPVAIEKTANSEGFKGTRVSVLGLRDLKEWQRRGRLNEITKSLAKLISPFEATSTFPVKVTLDGVEQSLVTVTNDVLTQAVADFTFQWEEGDKPGTQVLVAEARFRKRLFMSKQSNKLKARTIRVFEADNGSGFAKYLATTKRLKHYSKDIDVDAHWFVKLKTRIEWTSLIGVDGATSVPPGSFVGAFYFFHLDKIDDREAGAASGVGVDRNLIKEMSGIAILRDGFRVRSHGDWLELSTGMTSGSTYNLRPENTIGYFALAGSQNYRLIEKSDREGFVEDATFRGFLKIARACRDFSNDALEAVRRSLDEYARKEELPEGLPISKTAEGAFKVVEDNLRSASEAKVAAEAISAKLQAEVDDIEKDVGSGEDVSQKAIQLAANTVKAIDAVKSKLVSTGLPEFDLVHLKHEFEDRSERALSLLESAAVGLSARGLAHELRTHLTDIRQRALNLEKAAQKNGWGASVVASLRAIRTSCSAIANAASLIDPMLPRTRTIKEPIDLRELIEHYVKSRDFALNRAGIKIAISGASITVRANRSRLMQVIDNLVRNSIYWLRQGEASGDVVRPKEIIFRFTQSGFTVEDSGPGVDPRYEETLFDIFVSAKPNRDPGQGLGLYIVKQLLQLDGCDVTLLGDRNSEGRRFVFDVSLFPLVRA